VVASRELYLYWRVARPDVAEALAAMQRFQLALEAEWPGLQSRLFVRADDDGTGDATLMESYAREGGIAPGLQADIVTRGAQAAERWCRGPRHVEVFEGVAR
jgi:hypothetical protein